MKSLFLFSALALWGCGTTEFPIEDSVMGGVDLVYPENHQESVSVYRPLMEEDNVEEGHTWHDDFIEDSCARCPSCCVEIDDREAERVHCTPDLCPGINCLCVLDSEGVWWLDATRAGTDDVE